MGKEQFEKDQQITEANQDYSNNEYQADSTKEEKKLREGMFILAYDSKNKGNCVKQILAQICK